MPNFIFRKNAAAISLFYTYNNKRASTTASHFSKIHHLILNGARLAPNTDVRSAAWLLISHLPRNQSKIPQPAGVNRANSPSKCLCTNFYAALYFHGYGEYNCSC